MIKYLFQNANREKDDAFHGAKKVGENTWTYGDNTQ